MVLYYIIKRGHWFRAIIWSSSDTLANKAKSKIENSACGPIFCSNAFLGALLVKEYVSLAVQLQQYRSWCALLSFCARLPLIGKL
jgi:hypothetical protein